MIEQIPGYQKERDKKIFLSIVENSLLEKGYKVSLDIGDDYETTSKKIWDSCVAEKVFLSRRKNNYFAESVLDECQHFFNHENSYEFIIEALTKYFEHENDIAESVMVNDLESNKELIHNAKAELMEKFKELKELSNKSENSIHKLNDISYIKGLLTLGYYQK